MDKTSKSKHEERFYSINIDKLPAKIKIKTKHIHQKSTRNSSNLQYSRREKGKLYLYDLSY